MKTDPSHSSKYDRTMVVRRLDSHIEASLIAAALVERGIPATLKNTGSQSVLPISMISPIDLVVRAEDFNLAQQTLAQMDKEAAQISADETYHNATHDDIEYYKQINQPRGNGYLWWILAGIMIFVMVRALNLLPGV